MRKILSLIFQASFVACCSLITHSPVTAQSITTDGTLAQPTEVTPTDAGVEINGGTAQGNNLFHSFNDFSVPTGTEAYFNNNVDVVNILNRVTGGDISNIDGLIRANGGANLFLINPAGIVFGSDASLDIGGSFFGSTADSLLFEEGGEFSAVNPEVEPILTINAPIGLNLRDNPQPITANGVELNVSSGNNITLVGGELNFNGGILTAPGGRIELGGLSTAGEIGISEDGSLSFAEAIAKADITLSNDSLVDVRGEGGGNINVNAGNLDLTESSFLRAGITVDSTSSNSQVGDIDIALADKLTLDQSGITNQVNPDAVGNAGNINITADSIEATNGGEIDASTNGQGDGGNINLTATGDILFDGETSEGEPSRVRSRVNSSGEGNAGSVSISANNLTLSAGGRVDSSTSGEGDAGNATISATEDITFDGETSEGEPSGVTSRVNSNGEGNAGSVTVSANNLTLKNRGRVDVMGTGGGNITVEARNLELTADSELRAGITGDSISSDAQAGDILINLTDTGNLTLDRSNISNEVNSDGAGNSGSINITTGSIEAINGGRVDTSTSGEGDAGSINLTATGDITFDGETSEGEPSRVRSRVNSSGEGNAGSVSISANNLTLSAGGRVDSSTSGEGDAGNATISATEDITFDGETSEGEPSGVTSRVNSNGEGNAGSVTVSANNLTLNNRGQVDVMGTGGGNITVDAGNLELTADSELRAGITADSTSSNAQAGDILINLTDSGNLTLDQSRISNEVNSDGVGNSGSINITTGSIEARNGGRVDASTSGEGNAGSVDLTATGDITFDGENSQGDRSGATSRVDSAGNGKAGNVNISANNLTLSAGGQVDSSTSGQGDAGSVGIIATRDILFDGETSEGNRSGATSRVNSSGGGNAGNVNISANNLTLRAGGQVDSSTSGEGNAGSVNITATGNITFDGETSEGNRSGATSRVNSEGNGNAGGVSISGNNLTLSAGGRVDSSTRGQGDEGSVSITTEEDVILQDDSLISAQASENARGGNLSIDARFIIAFPGNSDIIASAEQGQGGEIDIKTQSLLGIEKRDQSSSTNDINASSDVQGLDGTVNLTISDINLIQGWAGLPSNVVVPEETTEQACEAHGEVAGKNGLTIKTKGGIPADPGLPLNSLNVSIDGETNPISAVVRPIKTSQGEIQPARGIEITESGKVILTAYPTDNSGNRLLAIKRNCV